MFFKSKKVKQRIAKNRDKGIACCPRCGSSSITANKKGFGIRKAALGGLIVGPIGLLAGGLGSRKLKVTCLNCGKKFLPGQRW